MILVEVSLHEGNVTSMETCNKCLLDNFLHYFSICGEGFLDINLIIYAVGGCVFNVVFKYLRGS